MKKSYDDFYVTKGVKKAEITIFKANIDDLNNPDFNCQYRALLKEFNYCFININNLDYYFKIPDQNYSILFAKDKADTLIGFACIKINKIEKELELNWLYIKGSNRFQGVGSQMMKELFKIALLNQCDNISLRDASEHYMPFVYEHSLTEDQKDNLDSKLKSNFYHKQGNFKEQSTKILIQVNSKSLNPITIFNQLNQNIEKRYHLEGLQNALHFERSF
ncbi:GNAT family N-acetyltransferase [Thiotrichales bacterium 19X7-9]|nr:GNAT family N-acetyltransferase [Thiotrichales bacterium 19X7-9]